MPLSRHALLAAMLVFAAMLPLLAFWRELNLYADGALFSYAVAAGDAWAMHWRNISSRALVWLVAYLPAQALIALTGRPDLGVGLYTLLFYGAPLLGLFATVAIDRAPGRPFALAAGAATVALLPLVAPFPSELIFTHALFFPTLALAWRGVVRLPGQIGLTVLMSALLMSHEGGLILAVAVICACALGLPDRARLVRALAALAPALALWFAVRLAFRPDGYVAFVLEMNAGRMLAIGQWFPRAVLWCGAAALAAGLLALVLAGPLKRAAPLAAAAICAGALVSLWVGLSPSVHGFERYDVRILLLVGDAAFAGVAALAAARVAGEGRWLMRHEPAFLGPLLPRLGGPALAALLAVAVVHAGEMQRFVSAFDGHRSAIRALATGEAADPALGHPAFVTVERRGQRYADLDWDSTLPFQSVLLTPGYHPKRLVVDAEANYFWFDCATARANEARDWPLPRETRALISAYTCGRRP